MKKTNILSILLAMAFALPGLKAEVLLCKASDSTEFKSCLNGHETNIKIMDDFTVNLTGFSLEGITIDVGSRTLTITGNPDVDSTTVFNTSGASGVLIIVGTNGTFTFKENTVHGGVDLDFLNKALRYPYYAATLQEALNMAVILPVSWLDFKGELEGENVLLEWATATELNNRSFVIESSSQGEVFRRIGEVEGAGNSTEAQHYRFEHRTPSAGVNYYRIKQVDFDGQFSYSKILAVDAAGSAQILLYPNPAATQFYLQYDAAKGNSQIQAYDALGRLIPLRIAGYAGYYELRWPEELAAGTYWLRVMQQGRVYTRALLKK